MSWKTYHTNEIIDLIEREGPKTEDEIHEALGGVYTWRELSGGLTAASMLKCLEKVGDRWQLVKEEKSA